MIPRGGSRCCAPFCFGKVSVSWQVEGSSFRVELSNYLEASYMPVRSGNRSGIGAVRWRRAAVAVAVAAARDGHRTAPRCAVAQSGLDKEPRKRVIPRQRVCQSRCFPLRARCTKRPRLVRGQLPGTTVAVPSRACPASKSSLYTSSISICINSNELVILSR